MGTTHFKSNVDIAGNLTVGDSGIFNFPSSATAPASPEVGDAYYNTTSGKMQIYQDAGWSSVDGSAAGSLDAAYNGGATVTVDAGAVTLTDSQTTTGGGLLITKSGVVTGANAASVFHINSTGAHDTSGALKMIEISVGAETVSGGIYGVEIAMNAHADYALTATKGSVVITDGDFTVSAAGVTTANGFTVTTANTSGDGIIFDLDSVTTGDAFVINCTTDVVAYLSIQTDDVAIWSINGTDVLQTVPLEINSDDANALLVEEADGTTVVLAVDASAGAGDTTFTMTGASETITGKVVNVTGSITTGNVVEINADAVTTGNALLISVTSGTMTTAGAAISVIDATNADREVFAVRDDGSVYMYGTAEGTTATQTVKGDMVITDGDLTVSGGEVAFTSDANAAGLVIVNNTVTTANSLVDVSSTSISTGALMRLNANTAAHDGEVLEVISAGDATSTPVGVSVTIASPTTGAARGIEVTMVGATTTAKGIAVTMDAITTGDMLYLDNGGNTMTTGGFYINCNDDNVSDFTVAAGGATVILGVAAGTDAFTITSGDILLDDSDQNIIESEDGTATTLLIDNKAGAVGSGNAVLKVDAGGVVDAAGYGIYATFTGSAAAGATVIGVVPDAGSVGIAVIASGVATSNALSVDADPTAASAVYFLSQGALAADKATLEVSSDVATCNADSSVVRITQDSTTGVAFCMTLKQDDLSEPFINFECTSATGNSVDTHNDTEGALGGFLRVAVNGTDGYLSFYAAPSKA